jgi:DNA invertase Pin-like site-specific DNA recombinase
LTFAEIDYNEMLNLRRALRENAMAQGNFVAYYRVSTAKQGKSGLGLEAQRAAVAEYLDGGDWTLCTEVTEIESGTRKSARPQLDKALAACRVHGATLIIAKIDRLARDTEFLLKIARETADNGVVFCDLPNIPAGPVGKFMVTQMAAVAELEAGLISQRTKAALAAAKARGVKLGGFRGVHFTDAARKAGPAARQAIAKARAADLKSTIETIQAEGITSLGKIAAELTARRVPTARGGSEWTAMQVSRVLALLDCRIG